jgi:D-proline reductase (dithiol) PrdB
VTIRLKNRIIASIITRFPSLSKGMINSYNPIESIDIPWTPMSKPLSLCKISIVTTAGVHVQGQTGFDMLDKSGDPTMRVINISDLKRLMITHDYYDHTDADRDINIVFPIDRLIEFEKEGVIGKVSQRHFGFMGHIIGEHINTLINVSAKELINNLKEDMVDVVILTPG